MTVVCHEENRAYERYKLYRPILNIMSNRTFQVVQLAEFTGEQRPQSYYSLTRYLNSRMLAVLGTTFHPNCTHTNLARQLGMTHQSRTDTRVDRGSPWTPDTTRTGMHHEQGQQTDRMQGLRNRHER